MATTEKYTFRSAARLIDDALEAVEKENPRLKGFIEKNRYMQLQLEPAKLVGLISEVVSSIPFRHASLNAKDILGHVYEYFLGQFALAEGKQGGQFYTPKSIVSVIVAMLEPYSGKVYDPAMGSGGFFVQSERFIEEHGGKLGAISVYGQLRNSTTVDWQIRDSVRAKMRILIKRLLKKYKYPPEGQEEAVTLVLKQAEALADEWSTS